ncbi:hypothetical protein QM012_008030 [Aureobasidium pullulans]|uniref:Ubiquitin 3 binding protein But2 C-terminal domain-containing protein n=1 Tax=Aureobasidium pullulans TaxID=5580 RepID=A0ABR0TLC8_AURPU
MYSRNITYIWALLAIGLTIVSGLPSLQLDNDEFECESWDAEANSTQVTPSTSAKMTTTPTSLVRQTSIITSSSHGTFITSVRIAQASSTGEPSPTNSFVAPVNSFIPVTPPSYAFYLQSSGTGYSDGLYAKVNAGAGGVATFTTRKSSATKFTIDSSGDLVEQSPSQGYVAALDPNNNPHKVVFNAYGGSSSTERLNCQRQNGVLSCGVNGVQYHAASCGNDGALYFTRTTAAGCIMISLVPVFS